MALSPILQAINEGVRDFEERRWGVVDLAAAARALVAAGMEVRNPQPKCGECDRPAICNVILPGTRPCDVDPDRDLIHAIAEKIHGFEYEYPDGSAEQLARIVIRLVRGA